MPLRIGLYATLSMEGHLKLRLQSNLKKMSINLAGEISAFQFEILELLLRVPGWVVPVEEPQVNLLTRHLKSENITGVYILLKIISRTLCISS